MDKKSVRAVWLVVVASHTSVLGQSSLLSVSSVSPLSHTVSPWPANTQPWTSTEYLAYEMVHINEENAEIFNLLLSLHIHTHYMCQHAHQTMNKGSQLEMLGYGSARLKAPENR